MCSLTLSLSLELMRSYSSSNAGETPVGRGGEELQCWFKVLFGCVCVRKRDRERERERVCAVCIQDLQLGCSAEGEIGETILF